MQNQLSPIDKLIFKPQQFDFFQAVRLLMLHKRQEVVRFHGKASLQFPVSAIAASQIAVADETGIDVLQVTFLGLYGCNGILPNHYTELIIQRLQAKDTVLRDFLDIFNHRIISLFYEAWEKYHFFVGYERAQLAGTTDKFSKMMASLIGNGTEHLQNRLSVQDNTFFYYADLFAKLPRSASGLKAILSDYFRVDVEIEQFQGRWLRLQESVCTRLANSKKMSNIFNCLGRTTLLGCSVWDIQNNFRVKIFALSYKEFIKFLPAGLKILALTTLVRRYIGINLNFDVQLVLRAIEVPDCGLLGKNALGWNCWLKSKAMLHDVQDTVLFLKFSGIYQ